MDDRLVAALPFVAWSRVWSPLASETLRDQAWSELRLPGHFAEHESAFLDVFVVGLGGPPVPLLLHAALGKDGGTVREDWMRVVQHLDLHWKEQTLPPDHLGVACDVLARAIEREEGVLIRELRTRYLGPWCEIARERLEGRDDELARLPETFSADLVGIGEFGAIA